MKMFANQCNPNAKTKLTFALCTVLALSLASLRADDTEKDKSKSQGGAGANASSQTGQAGSLSRTDNKFAHEAAKSSMIEIKMGKLATQKAQNEQVKQFGQRLVDDHTKASMELKQIAASKGITLPDASAHASATAGTSTSTSGTEESDRTRVRDQSDPEARMHKAHGEMMKKLEGLSGTEFDRAFVRMAVTHHEKDVKDFEKASESVQDPGLKAFAAKTLPTLREHLSQAKSLQSQVGGAGAPGEESGTQSGESSDKSSSSGSSTDASETK